MVQGNSCNPTLNGACKKGRIGRLLDYRVTCSIYLEMVAVPYKVAGLGCWSMEVSD